MSREVTIAAVNAMLTDVGMPMYTELREELRKVQDNYYATGKKVLENAKASPTVVQSWEDLYTVGCAIIQKATP